MATLDSTNSTWPPWELGGFSSPLRNYSPTNLTTTLLLTFVVLLLTRFFTGQASETSAIGPDGAQRPPKVPYWIPIVGHIPQMTWDATAFVSGLRSRYNQGAFALQLAGTTHNLLYTPGLATALLGQKAAVADHEGVGIRMMHTVFGLNKSELPQWKIALPDLEACYRHLLTEPSLEGMVRQTAERMKANVVSLVTFSRSPVDDMPWERVSSVQLSKNSDGEEVAEASLLPLIRDFCAHTSNASIIGSNFLENFPDYFDDLWNLDRGFLLLVIGLPRWVPILKVTRAHISKRKLMKRLVAFHTALERHANGEDPGSDWRDLDDVSELIKARMEVYRKYGLSIHARAAAENALLWATNANSNTLVFWMVNRIYSDPTLLECLRQEILPYIKAVQPSQDLPIAEAPRFETFDVEGLCNKCPLLKSCYVESLRLDTASWSLKVVKQDFVLHSREKDVPSWVLRKGEYCHAAHDLHNTDPKYFKEPTVWKADRHVTITKDENGKECTSADFGSIRPYGGGSSMCKGRAFAFKEVMLFAATIISLWEIEPAGGRQWRIPRHVKATSVYNTTDSTRVWLKRRKLPQSSQ